ncbi:unnamed protein product [Dibothriocephalus latus]|uniref:Uncharacterized protein n=1 Tax=Dibothriocephalus latus TaxID=60516 RepID=A0A3P7NX66_DIBLA|nr:unnamed protein product [Dibothriocephalus latus]
MIFSAWGAIFAGFYICISALRRRRLPKEAFVYSHDTAPEAGKREGEDKDGGAAGQVSDGPQSLSTITEPSYLSLFPPSSSTISTDSYPILMRQAPTSPTAGAGGGDDDDGGYGRLLLTQLNHLFSTGPYSLLETGCQSPVSDQPEGDATAVAAATATEDELGRDTDGNEEDVTGRSRADGPDTPAFEAAYGTLVAIGNHLLVFLAGLSL